MFKFDYKFMKENERVFKYINSLENDNDKEKLLTEYMQNIENKLAEQENRKPAIVKINIFQPQDVIESPYYDIKTNIIYLEYKISCNPNSFVISLQHEDEHCNQVYSTKNTKEEIEMNDISQATYFINDDDIDIEYICNYKELGAILREMTHIKQLLDDIKQNNIIISQEDGKEIYTLMNKIIDNTNYIRQRDIFYILKYNITSIKKAKSPIIIPVSESKVKEINKKQALKFLITKAPKLYFKRYFQIKTLNSFLLIQSAHYYKSYIEIDTLKRQHKQKEMKQKIKRYNKAMDTTKYVEYIPNNEFVIQFNVNGIENFEKMMKKLSKKDSILNISVMGVPEQENFRIFCSTVDNTEITKKVLSEIEDLHISNNLEYNFDEKDDHDGR